MHVCTVLINGICHRALRCISRFTLAPPGLCLALCFAPSARLVPSTRRGCIRSRNTGRVVHFYPPLPYFSLPSLITLVTLLMLWLQSLRHSSRTEILRRAPANCQIFPCYDTRYLISYSLSKLFRRSLVFGSLVFRCTCFSVFFPFCFSLLTGIHFAVCAMEKMRGARGWQSNGTDRVLSRSVECTDEPFIFQYLILKHWDHPSRIRLSQKHATFVIGWCTIQRPVVSLAGRASKTIVCPALNEVDYLSYSIAKEDPRKFREYTMHYCSAKTHDDINNTSKIIF